VARVRARILERIAGLVYLDAFVPENGKAIIDYVPPESKAMLDRYRARDSAIPRMPLGYLGLEDAAVTEFCKSPPYRAPSAINLSTNQIVGVKARDFIALRRLHGIWRNAIYEAPLPNKNGAGYSRRYATDDLVCNSVGTY
jgi:hypothetical protein